MTLSLRTFELPLSHPLETAAGTIETRRGVAIRWRTADTLGVGTAEPLPGWTESYDRCVSELQDVMRTSANGELSLDAIDETMPATRHGVHLARADAAARKEEQSLADALEGNGPKDVPACGLIGAIPPGRARRRATRLATAGYPAIKCKVGDDLDLDVARIEVIRRAVGPDVELRADANRGWNVEAAREALSRLADFDVSYVEEPIRDPTPARIRRVSESEVGIAVDESINADGDDVETWAALADVVIVKPMALGGIDRARALARRARQHGLSVVISNTVDSVVARTAAVHLAASTAEPMAAGLATADRLERDLAADPAPIRCGYHTIPETPGNGTLGPWDRAAIGGGHGSNC